MQWLTMWVAMHSVENDSFAASVDHVALSRRPGNGSLLRMGDSGSIGKQWVQSSTWSICGRNARSADQTTAKQLFSTRTLAFLENYSEIIQTNINYLPVTSTNTNTRGSRGIPGDAKCITEILGGRGKNNEVRRGQNLLFLFPEKISALNVLLFISKKL